tara:strand:+ start:370 stop:786 length:417 start_codon:yes stop_codon:yes gene_type:complete
MNYINKYLKYLKNSLIDNYFSIKGRASVIEYRIFISYVFLLLLVTIFYGIEVEDNIFEGSIIISIAYVFVIAIPLITITIRRLHDLNFPTGSIFILLIIQAFGPLNYEYIGDIIGVGLLLIFKGKKDENDYGNAFKPE